MGRTARAGRSGKSITLVTQYDVELFQRIEHLIGKQLPLYKTTDNEVMLLQERVSEAQRLAKIQAKEDDDKKKSGGAKRKANGSDAEEDTEEASGVRKRMRKGGPGNNKGGGGNHKGNRPNNKNMKNKRGRF